ncbi:MULTISPECIES: hypothetical protein [unclassified Coleofasciculus]|uniref:hypothetical protein n=1 Tax=unclassified Coleofasciculus TaxID=2692782 RepID=UPI001882844C|nr:MULTISPECIES: hypothetical protein [unclassified Coleofasciculus]MBE9125598.1 hypothetical protein [Coleofasciculus sp. LEGE 07081]MBE9147312.1 hypothetical protein [Coleofasciculus sp. LEGE 07092]
MAISNWAAQRSLLLKSYNQEVKKLYRENSAAFDRVERLTKVQALEASLILNKDSQLMAKAKQDFYYNQVLRTPYQPEIWQAPDYTNISQIEYDPQIILLFRETKERYKAANRRQPLRVQCSLRLKESIVESLRTSNNRLETISNQIEIAFGKEEYDKGRRKFTYKNDSLKHRFYFNFNSEAQARELLTKTLALQDQTPDFDHYWSESSRPAGYHTIRRETVYGEVMEYPALMPQATCKFYRATAHFFPAKPILLVENLIDHL